MRPVFADPKTDFVFKKLFGTEEHRDLLIALLNALLDLRGERAIRALTFLREEERPKVEELKYSIVDVKCTDHQGTVFVVEMQVLQVQGFEERVVYNASKAYVNQLARGDDYPHLNDVVAISICDFVLWPDTLGQPAVPLVSHWRVQESGGRLGLGQVRYVFVELPKLPEDRPPSDELEEWAFVFRNAQALSDTPSFLHGAGPRQALDAARTAGFSAAEWEAYDRAKVAEQDARGALDLARERGRAEGVVEGHAAGVAAGQSAALRTAIEALCEVLGVPLDDTRRAWLSAASAEALTETLARLRRSRAW
ncbi:MAG: Rpn family recombination-promoting nuclease/putative transposase [Deltaproteobacteria bacterium]|nr:Rpn family recombination-promoting nuclease/putative transposase [Deltaproteobacteria bacterium]